MPSPPFPAWNYRREYENPYDNDFLSIEDLVYGFTRYASSDDDDDEEDEEPRNNNKHLNCPVCKTRHEFVPPSGSPRSTTGSSAATAEQYSHHARVIYASFACPICLEDQAGPPMVCLPCGHAVCEKDFRLLGGSTSDAAEDTRVRQENEVVTNEHQRGNINNSNTTHGASEEEVEYVSMALMHAFAQRLMHEAEEEAAARRQTRVETSERTTSNAGDDEYLHDFGEEEDSYEHDYCPVLQLMDYHDNNAEEYDKPPAEGFPKTGIWLLVPDVTTDDLSLMYYCDHPHQSNAEDDDYEPVYFIEQFPRGTKLIPNGPHGVYVYAPEYEGSMVWDIFYVKNIPPR